MTTSLVLARQDAAMIAQWLSTTRFAVSDEARLQTGIEQYLTSRAIPFEREVRLSARDRIDFMIANHIGVECKVDGSPSAIIAQLLGYLQYETVHSLILLTAKARLASGLPREVTVRHANGTEVTKPLLVAVLWQGGL